MTFKELSLIKELLEAVEEKGYTTPTPIQEQVIPLILKKRDLMAGAQTGTGKTAGFTLPILQLLMESPSKKEGKRAVRALILAPTRELAAQIAESVKSYGKYLPLRSVMICGGMNNQAQARELRKGVDIVIATPGRLLDHVSQKTLNLSQVEVFVLDEADRMLDMGFVNDIKKIIALMPKDQQSLMFSATFSHEVKNLASTFLKSHETITVARQNASNDLVAQTAYSVDQKRKQQLLSFLISSKKWKQVLVFTRTKHGANKLAEQLDKDGISNTVIHGNKTQGARSRALQDFKQGKVCAMVATDVAARGLDIHSLPYVVNFEVPNAAEDYIHRIGRTGRAGNTGEAISFVCIDEVGLFKSIERLLEKQIPLIVEPGYEPDPSIKAKAISRGRRSGGGGGGGRREGFRSGSGSDAPRTGFRGNGSRGDSPRSNFRSKGPRSDSPREYTPRSDTPREYTPRSDSPRSDAPRSNFRSKGPRSDGPRSDAPRSNFRSNGPRSDGPRSSGAPRSTFRSKGPGSDGPRSDAPRSSFRSKGPRSDSPRSDAPRSSSRSKGPRSDAPPRSAGSHTGPRSAGPRSDGPKSDAPRGAAPRKGFAKKRY